MRKKAIISVLVLGILSLFVLGGMPFDENYKLADYHGFGTGGLNLFSTPDNLDGKQVVDMVNLLPEGSYLRPRKGLTKMNTTSLGTTPIWGIYKLVKASGASQYVVSWGGRIWLYDGDTEEFSNLIKESAACDSVHVTNASDTVLSYNTELTGSFRDYGYRDSIAIYLGDSLRYIDKILNDSSMVLHLAWAGDTDSLVATLPFQVSNSRPTQFVQWMNDLYVPGLRRLCDYDGESAILQSATKITYNVTTVATQNSETELRLTCTPNRSKGNNYFNDWYLSYEDGGEGLRLNIPLQIKDFDEAGSNSYFTLRADSSLESHISTESWDSVWLVPSLGDIDTIATVIIDSVTNTKLITTDVLYHVYDFSVLPASDSNKYNYGFYCFEGKQNNHDIDCWGARHPVRACVENDSSYFYGLLSHCSQGDTLSKGDTVYLVHYTEDWGETDVPSFMEIWQDRAWYAGYADDPNLIEYSEQFDPDSILGTYFIYVDRDDGDVVTGLKVMSFQDYLLVFQEHSIKAITTSGLDAWDWTVNDIVQGIGTPSWASIISHGRNVYFYDYSGFYVLNGVEVQKMSWAIEPIVTDSIHRDYAHLIVGGYFDNFLWWSYPSGNATQNNRTVLFNLETQAWTKVDFNFASVYVGLDENDDYGVLLGAVDSGVVWMYGLTYFDDGASITASYESGWLDMEDGYDLNKEFKDWQLLLDKHDSTQIYVDMYRNYSASSFTSDTIGIDDYDILKYRKRSIGGYNLGQRLKLNMTITRIDENFRMPFYKIKWKPTDEVLYDGD